MADEDCFKCNEGLPSDGDYVFCGGCNGGFHYGNCSIARSTYTAMGSRRRDAWRCESCREKKKNKDESVDTGVDTTRNMNEMNTMKEDIKGIKAILESLKESIENIVQSQQFISDKYDEIIREQGGMRTKIKSLETKMINMEPAIDESDKNVNYLMDRVLELERHGNRKSVEIHGVLEDKNEIMEEIVMSIARKLDVGLNVSDLDYVGRQWIKDKDKPRPVIVKFYQTKKRDEIIGKKNIIITNSDVVNGRTGGRIRILESLSTLQKRLLWESKRMAKDKGWKFVWVQDGNVLARRDEGSRIMRIQGFPDLIKIN